MKSYVLGLLILFSSCASLTKLQTALNPPQSPDVTTKRMTIYFDSIVAQNIPPASKIYLENKNPNALHLEKELFKNAFRDALISQGLTVVDNIANADYLVFFNYALIPENKIESRPVYNWSQPSTYNYYSSGPGGISSGTIQQSGIGQLSYAGTRQIEYVVNHNFLNIICLEKVLFTKEIRNKLSDISRASIWQTEISSTSNSSDIKFTIPMMMRAFSRSITSVQTGRFQDTIVEQYPN